MKIVYQVTVAYEHSECFQSEDLVMAARYAAAAALHTGKSFTVRRTHVEVTDSTVSASSVLFTTGPSTIDFRRVSAETVIGMKALAHDLMPGIDELVPPIPQEGFK